ncbi:MAG: hypothetical protein ACRBB0_21970 [Pelagimonas sp.]
MSDYNTIFVGNGKNANAVNAGMDAIQFTDPEALDVDLKQRGLL